MQQHFIVCTAIYQPAVQHFLLTVQQYLSRQCSNILLSVQQYFRQMCRFCIILFYSSIILAIPIFICTTNPPFFQWGGGSLHFLVFVHYLNPNGKIIGGGGIESAQTLQHILDKNSPTGKGLWMNNDKFK